MPAAPDQPHVDCDVLVVGAGPTGLTLAAALDAFGASVQLIDRAYDRVHESRALAVQPRTLEVLRQLGLADELVRRGNPTVHLGIHAGNRVTSARLFDIGLDDTAFPFLLFVSQSETEGVLSEHISRCGIAVDRGHELLSFAPVPGAVSCLVRTPGRHERLIRARYLVGCDGARSTVRERAWIPFHGSRYPQTFLLADTDVDGLEPGAVHTYVADHGPLLFFPLGRPAPWRLIAMRPPGATAESAEQPQKAPVTVAELQRLCDLVDPGQLRIGNPVWASAFHVHLRHAETYRSDRTFLAGDAAHIHSPVGAQGMNTGIQDAWNLGWKLALVCRGLAPEQLLDTYDAERRPVGRFVLRFTDRGFTAVTSTNPLLRLARSRLAPRVLPWVLRSRAARAAAFRTVSQLDIRYRSSPAVDPDDRQPRPQAGDRLPDARVAVDGQRGWLHEMLREPAFHLLLCGPPRGWDGAVVDRLRTRFGGLLAVHHLDRQPGPGVMHDVDGSALARLRVRGAVQLVVRPDGYVGHRSSGPDLAGSASYLERWLIPPP